MISNTIIKDSLIRTIIINLLKIVSEQKTGKTTATLKGIDSISSLSGRCLELEPEKYDSNEKKVSQSHRKPTIKIPCQN